METTGDDRAHGYDDRQEQEAYESAETSGDPDAGPASDVGDVQPDQAEGESGDV